ncbi:MAG: peptidoglycan editing factor PgeF [Usitatibacter sp.]
MIPREWITPEWPAPDHVRAFVTTRQGGVSSGEYGSLNLGTASGDNPQHVARNRLIVREQLPATPRWMMQVHGNRVADLDRLGEDDDVPTADAAVTGTPRTVGVVLTADCMPLFLCDAEGFRVAVVHAGWRGMAAGVIENAVAALKADPRDVLAWMGPAIGPGAFEVGPEVREAFLAVDPDAADTFEAGAPGKFMADLYELARRRLEGCGVEEIYGGGFCTRDEPDRFFSYRRVPESGRMGAFIWME